MKKVIFSGLGITLPMLAISLISYGQNAVTTGHFSNGISSAEDAVSKTGANTLRRGDVNSKAAKDFVRSYKNVSDEKWFEVPGVLLARFARYGIDYRIDYDKKGHWLHTIRTYDENELPGAIRHIVKSTYYDYNIAVVQEIEEPKDNFTYIVHLEGKTKLINLRVFDGEMEEWQKFQKSE